MIPFFVGYALLVWFGSARHRRTWLGWGCVGLGVGGLVLLSYGHWIFGRLFPELMPQGLQILMYPYTVVVGAVGIFITLMPRAVPAGVCAGCEYDLRGLGHPVAACPECGRPVDAEAGIRHRSSGSPRDDLRSGDSGLASAHSATQGSPRGTADQDQRGQASDQDPSDRIELRGRERLDGGDRPGIGTGGDEFVLARQPGD